MLFFALDRGLISFHTWGTQSNVLFSMVWKLFWYAFSPESGWGGVLFYLHNSSFTIPQTAAFLNLSSLGETSGFGPQGRGVGCVLFVFHCLWRCSSLHDSCCGKGKSFGLLAGTFVWMQRGSLTISQLVGSVVFCNCVPS